MLILYGLGWEPFHYREHTAYKCLSIRQFRIVHITIPTGVIHLFLVL